MIRLGKIHPFTKILAAAAVFFGTLAAAAAVAFADPATVYVKSTGCSAAGPGTQAQPFCTIQQGIDAAVAGDTVKVLSGSYLDAVDVNKSLDLVGSDATVTAAGPNGLTLSADNILVRGFTFSGKTDGPALYANPNFSDYQITKNTFSNNVFGLYLHSSGTTASRVNHNTFDSNNQPGSATSNGIYTDQGIDNVRIDHNVFKNQQNAALIFTSTATAVTNDNLEVDHNRFNGPGTMFILVNGHNVSFDHNKGSGFTDSSAVFLGGSNGNVNVSHNSLAGGLTGAAKNAFSGIRINVDQANFGGPDLTLTPNNLIKIHHNSAKDFGDAGVSVGNSDGDTVTLTNSQIHHNKLTNNGDVHAGFDGGILIRAPNGGNTINHNKMNLNNPFDAEDNSTGTGTAGTGNTWHHNSCSTSSPAGLCS